HVLSPTVLDFSAGLRRARRDSRLPDLAVSVLGGRAVRRRDRGGATGLANARGNASVRVRRRSVARFQQIGDLRLGGRRGGIDGAVDAREGAAQGMDLVQ